MEMNPDGVSMKKYMYAIDVAATHRRKAGVKNLKKERPKIDMTPMVDLGFLLISFFVITTELNEPRSATLNMPKDGPLMPLGDSSALTVLLAGNDKIYYYQGNWNDAVNGNKILKTDFSSLVLRNAILQQKHQLDLTANKRDGLMLLIKSTGEASYKNVIDVLDEALINNVKKYTIVKAEAAELEWIKDQL
ncbi:MAG TPA: biopolymer transporter ExbD [Chitinophagaceae bacterium]|nr:biopolymer transporter ExbD [Chitinophagaceae bacterium]